MILLLFGLGAYGCAGSTLTTITEVWKRVTVDTHKSVSLQKTREWRVPRGFEGIITGGIACTTQTPLAHALLRRGESSIVSRW